MPYGMTTGWPVIGSSAETDVTLPDVRVTCCATGKRGVRDRVDRPVAGAVPAEIDRADRRAQDAALIDGRGINIQNAASRKWQRTFTGRK